MGRQAAPADRSGETKLVEQFGLVVRDAAREDLALPGICGGLEALQLLQSFQQAAFAQELRAWRQVLPAEEPAHELRGSYRGDLLAQLAERQAMDAGEEAALAPFGFGAGRICELAPEDGAARFEAKERFLDIGCGESENVCQRGCGDRAAVGHPAGQHSEAGVVLRCDSGLEIGELGFKMRGGKDLREGLRALGCDPVDGASNAGLRCALGAYELIEVGAPSSARVPELVAQRMAGITCG